MPTCQQLVFCGRDEEEDVLAKLKVAIKGEDERQLNETIAMAHEKELPESHALKEAKQVCHAAHEVAQDAMHQTI